ncbi:TetR/AcrR family transcriptional regulator [Nonomuraea rubra]|uniref:AcrR family transcriptional regulator n=1 Tax=Nonomuraea rubra TaxID=46180 RepID=A0A7X0U1S0_9ACTN|nr:TetR/AcrR family transcriptional regulator [Nonomuraea rubra]MBB6551971.1 AcrR family transcriptional regulator [Nonomuraea rubra]
MTERQDEMTGGAGSARPPGRPRSQEADLAILSAALDLLIEQGAALTSIEQVARRAGVTRATVYRRFADKTALLVRALEWANHDHDPGFTGWPDLEHMFGDWAAYLAVPRHRRLLRRLYGSVDDYPELVSTYRMVNGGRRAAVVRETLCRARDRGQLPRDVDVDVVQRMLTGAVLHEVGVVPDREDAAAIAAQFLEIMKQVGYRPAPATTES